MGAVREVAWADRSRSVAEAWREAQVHLNAHGQSSSVLVVCATHEDIAHVTAAIRLFEILERKNGRTFTQHHTGAVAIERAAFLRGCSLQ